MQHLEHRCLPVTMICRHFRKGRGSGVSRVLAWSLNAFCSPHSISPGFRVCSNLRQPRSLTSVVSTSLLHTVTTILASSVPGGSMSGEMVNGKVTSFVDTIDSSTGNMVASPPVAGPGPWGDGGCSTLTAPQPPEIARSGLRKAVPHDRGQGRRGRG